MKELVYVCPKAMDWHLLSSRLEEEYRKLFSVTSERGHRFLERNRFAIPIDFEWMGLFKRF